MELRKFHKRENNIRAKESRLLALIAIVEMKPSNTFVSCLYSSQNRSNMFNHQKEFSTMLATINVYL